MPSTPPSSLPSSLPEASTRAQIVGAADRLFYEQGYERTSFADIAQAVGISRGNFYYHFKSKDEILDAVIAARMAGTQDMLTHWEAQSAEPAARLRSFIDMLIANQTPIMRHGCPVGSLCSELARLDHAAQPQANALFTLFRLWLRRHFIAAGRKADADRLALHLMARSQGIAVLANTFRDAGFIRDEVQQLHDWLAAQLAPPFTNPSVTGDPDVHRAAAILKPAKSGRATPRRPQGLAAKRPR